MVLENARIFLVSGFEEKLVRRMFMEPYPAAQAAYDAALNIMGQDAGVIVMPFGGSTLPEHSGR